MTDKNREAFEKEWIERNPCNILDREKLRPDDYFSAFAQYGWQMWQAARDHYAPKLTESEAVEVAYLASIGKWTPVNKNTEEGWTAYIAEIIAALRAAGVQFKEEI